jgi:hypothetical protein
VNCAAASCGATVSPAAKQRPVASTNPRSTPQRGRCSLVDVRGHFRRDWARAKRRRSAPSRCLPADDGRYHAGVRADRTLMFS